MLLKKREMIAKAKRTFKDKVFFWKGIPVCTTPQLANFYECEEQRISHNFNYNRERFKVKDHYFRIVGKDVENFFIKINGMSKDDFRNSNITVLYLWTQRGAARHAKMLQTEKAWEVWEEMEKNYFEKNMRSDWTRVSDLVTPELLGQQRSISHQKDNSNKINAENVYSEEDLWSGRSKAMAYNRRNCEVLTERTPSSWREQGRELGLPRRVTCSAKGVARVVQPEIACARSLADLLILDGINEEVAFEVARSSVTTFRLLDESGWRPRSFQQY